MCIEILMPDGETLVTMRDAVNRLPVLITDQPVLNGDLDICLCSLRVDDTATANGYSVARHAHWLWVEFVQSRRTR